MTKISEYLIGNATSRRIRPVSGSISGEGVSVIDVVPGSGILQIQESFQLCGLWRLHVGRHSQGKNHYHRLKVIAPDVGLMRRIGVG